MLVTIQALEGLKFIGDLWPYGLNLICFPISIQHRSILLHSTC